MCHVLEVSRSGYYESVGRPPSARAVRRERIRNSVRQVHAESHGMYGSQKIAAVLDARVDLERACRHMVQRAMQE
jgi:putative transposase